MRPPSLTPPPSSSPSRFLPFQMVDFLRFPILFLPIVCFLLHLTPFPPSVSPLSDNFPPLVSPLSNTPTPTNKSIPIYENIHALMDSGSSDCFIDAKFVSNHQLATYSVTLLQLHLFDGSANSVITQAIDLNLRFATGNITPMTL